MTADIERITFISEGVRDETRKVYQGLLALSVSTLLLGVCLVLLVLFSCGFDSSRLRLAAVLVLPVTCITLWCACAVAYGLWLSSRDVCTATSSYLAATVEQRLESPLSVDLAPCAHYLAAGDLADSARETYVDLMQRANLLIAGAALALDTRMCALMPVNHVDLRFWHSGVPCLHVFLSGRRRL